ncbi:MAG: AtpZ/AtpI family protein [Pseudooceanicola sp.]|nr:AtpZ/AtpI family protein [Pseudooceanicola sp.]
MSGDDQKQRLAQLEARIAAAKEAGTPKPGKEEHYSQAQLAWRMVIELVAGLGIGFGMGYGLDRLFGTLPFLLVLFTLLGLAAGIKTMMRSAGEVQKKMQAAEAAGDDKGY